MEKSPEQSSQGTDWLDTENTTERRILDLRTIGMQRGLTLGRLHYTRASPPLLEQVHPNWLVLVFLLSGLHHYVVDGEHFDLHGGELLSIPPGSRYGTGALPEQKGELAWLIVNVDFENDSRPLGMSAAGAKQVFDTLAGREGGRVCPMPEDARQLIDSIFGLWERRGGMLVCEMIRNRVAALVIGAAARVVTPAMAGDGENDHRIRKVLHWMEEHPDWNVSGDRLAELAGLSPSRFHVHFKRLVGSSPKDYWVRLRVERAGRRLQETPGVTITEVAYEFGFSSSQYFATVFRRYQGVSPQEFRLHGLK